MPSDKWVAPAGTRLKRVCIANRGEIVSRIIRTCKHLNVTSIALYTRQDASSSFWREADEALCVGDMDQGNPYVSVDRMVAACKAARADAVHPGYGYLSENAGFAKAVIDAGLTWIGPLPETIDILGDKARCKAFLSQNAKHVPLVPGVTSTDQNDDKLAQSAQQVGFPILLKAAAGGGGKGMRIVNEMSEFLPSLQMARGESLRNFGSAEVLVEKYVARGKHVEVQVFRDAHGNAVYFGDRDCSVQRRHQKVIEESPAVVSQKLKDTMREAALEICRITGYRSAGTVEFIVDVDDERAYFLEVNTRIQVEHPITEEVWGIDLVALQLHVAAGGSLKDVPSLTPRGHAVQCRLYAESPRDNFLPQRGPVTMFRACALENTRYESSVQTGDAVSIYFDPMIAKIIVKAVDRESACALAKRVVSNTVCLGLLTNQQFLVDCLDIPSFRDASYTTAFVGENLEALTKPADIEHGALLASVIARSTLTGQSGPNQERSRLVPAQSEVITGPLGGSFLVRRSAERSDDADHYGLSATALANTADTDGVRAKTVREDPVALNKVGGVLAKDYYDAVRTPPGPSHYIHIHDRHTHVLHPRTDTPHTAADVHAGFAVTLRLAITPSSNLPPQIHHVIATVHRQHDNPGGVGPATVVHIHGFGTFVRRSVLGWFGRLDRAGSLEELSEMVGGVDGSAGGVGGNVVGGAKVKAPMPGKVVRIEAADGVSVDRGAGIVVIESMKTEVRLVAPINGQVQILVREGEAVEEGKLLALVRPAS
ncbi:hypothetical protein PYCC9005_002863 [Savitreella phatthalungensis]